MRKVWKRIHVFMLLTLVFCAASVLLQAKPAYAKVKLNKKTVYLAKGGTVTLKLKGTTKKPKWSSSDKSIAKVTKTGKVKAKKIGK